MDLLAGAMSLSITGAVLITAVRTLIQVMKLCETIHHQNDLGRLVDSREPSNEDLSLPASTAGAAEIGYGISETPRAFEGHGSASEAHRQERPSAVNFWQALDIPDQQALMAVARQRTFAGGAALFREGEQGDHVVVIQQGWTKICVHENGQERIIAKRGPGQLIGERATLEVNVRSATVVALNTVRALVLSTDDFAAFIGAHPYILAIVQGQLYDRLTEKPAHCWHDQCHTTAVNRLVTDWSGGNPADGERPEERPQRLNGENCTVLLTDIVRFGGHVRTDEDRLVVRQAHFNMLQDGFKHSQIPWARCPWEDRGDGLLIVVPPNIGTMAVMECLHTRLDAPLKRHNRRSSAPAQIKLRVAVHVGPVTTDTIGMSGEAIICAARLVDAPPLKRSIAESGAYLGIVASEYVYRHFIKNGIGSIDPDGYHSVQFKEKESEITAWMRLTGPALPL